MTVVEKTQYNLQSQVSLLPCIEMQFLSLQTWAFCPDADIPTVMDLGPIAPKVSMAIEHLHASFCHGNGNHVAML